MRISLIFSPESFQLQMGFLLPFLHAKDLCTSLLITRTHIFKSPVCRGYIRKFSVHSVQKYFLHDCSTDSISCSKRGKGIWLKQHQNDIATRQRQNSVTVSNLKASKINTWLSLPIHRACRQSTSTSLIVFNPFDASSILCWLVRCHFCSLCAHLPALAPSLSS